MKRYLIAVILIFLTTPVVFAQRLFTEDFNYSLGQLTSGNGGANVSGGIWTSFSGNGKYIQVVSPNLTYPNYHTSPSGSSASIMLDTSVLSAEDVYAAFASQTSGTVYCSFLINVLTTEELAPHASDSAEYFAGFFASNSTSNYFCRLFTRQGSAANTINFGIASQAFHTTPIQWAPSDYPINTIHLVTLGYQIITGTDNDVSKLWVDNPYSATEPTPLVSSVFTTGTEPINVTRVALRQGYDLSSEGSTPRCNIDAFKVSTSWADATLPVHLILFNCSYDQKNSVVLNWTTADEINMNKYVIEKSADAYDFTPIGEVSSKKLSNNNYSFTDDKFYGAEGFYRLKMINDDGSFIYSNILNVSNRSSLSSIKIYPNPVSNNLILSHPEAVAGSSFQIMDASGKLVKTYTPALNATQSSIDVSAFSKGSYFIIFYNGKTKLTDKFIKE